MKKNQITLTIETDTNCATAYMMLHEVLGSLNNDGFLSNASSLQFVIQAFISRAEDFVLCSETNNWEVIIDMIRGFADLLEEEVKKDKEIYG